MDGAHPQRAAANEFLVRMKDHPDMWRRADAILEVSKQSATKFFGLQVLTEAINTHWKVIPSEQREGIRSYVVTKIIALSTDGPKDFLSRLNLVLVQILKQDWPQNWPTFIGKRPPCPAPCPTPWSTPWPAPWSLSCSPLDLCVCAVVGLGVDLLASLFPTTLLRKEQCNMIATPSSPYHCNCTPLPSSSHLPLNPTICLTFPSLTAHFPIGDIVSSSKTSEALCENNMKVLQLLRYGLLC